MAIGGQEQFAIRLFNPEGVASGGVPAQFLTNCLFACGQNRSGCIGGEPQQTVVQEAGFQ